MNFKNNTSKISADTHKANNMPITMSISKSISIRTASRGFTLIEMMIAVAIIGILTAIAYPNYQRYVIKTKRTDMMSEMYNIATEIESRKLAKGSYKNITNTELGKLAGVYPKQGKKLYDVTITPNDPLTADWIITATAETSTKMAEDGNLSLNSQGLKCRGNGANKKCTTGDSWNP